MTESEEFGLASRIKEKARDIGFDLCGIAKARVLSEYIPLLSNWCEKGLNADMAFMARDIEKRFNPYLHLHDVKSVVVTGISYYSPVMQKQGGVPLISRYAYGDDYHQVISEKLEQLLEFVCDIASGAAAKYFIDSGTISEKMWAKEAGLGWQGRHSVIINKEIGSFFFIGIILTNVDLAADTPYNEDLCGSCRMCIDLCPTQAINEDRTIDARKCIANLTIENRGPIPEDIIPKLGLRVYGCDRCQEVCPWNRDALPCRTPEFFISEEIAEMTVDDWRALSEEKFLLLFSRSAIKRVKYGRFSRNIVAALVSEG